MASSLQTKLAQIIHTTLVVSIFIPISSLSLLFRWNQKNQSWPFFRYFFGNYHIHVNAFRPQWTDDRVEHLPNVPKSVWYVWKYGNRGPRSEIGKTLHYLHGCMIKKTELRIEDDKFERQYLREKTNI